MIVADNELAVTCFVWDGERPFHPCRVDTLASMLERQLHVPHKVVCICDHPQETFAHKNIVALKTPEGAERLANIKSPEGKTFPSCYRRLWLFSNEARDIIGKRIFLTDVDIVLVDDITAMITDFDDEPFVGWNPLPEKGHRNDTRLFGGHYLMTTGSYPKLYDSFSLLGVRRARERGFRGSDQAWLSYNLAGKVATWELKKYGLVWNKEHNYKRSVPTWAKLVTFAGAVKPWDCLDVSWIRKHYR